MPPVLADPHPRGRGPPGRRFAGVAGVRPRGVAARLPARAPRRAQPRQRLAFLLWPDSTEAQARTNLRKVLHTLRRELPNAERHLEMTGRTLRWRTDAPYVLDLADFEQAPAAGRLEGSYDEWVLEERERLRDRFLDALERLMGELGARGEIAEALSEATGRTIEYVDIPYDAAREAMLEAGLPPLLADSIVDLFVSKQAGNMSQTTERSARPTGREPRTFAQFAREDAAAYGAPPARPGAPVAAQSSQP